MAPYLLQLLISKLKNQLLDVLSSLNVTLIKRTTINNIYLKFEAIFNLYNKLFRNIQAHAPTYMSEIT